MRRTWFWRVALAAAVAAVGIAAAQEGEEVAGLTETVLRAVPVEAGGEPLAQVVLEFALEPGTETGQREQPQLVAYVLEGTLSVSVDGGPETAYAAGSTFTVEAGSTVSLANRGDAPARALCFAVLPQSALAGQ